MKYNILYYLAALASLISYSASAQNLDPTVEVSRDYEGKLLVVHKPILDMAVPDSVYRFDLDFDYSVTDTPYKGTYEFVPYSVNMSLEPGRDAGNSLYLRAGAGYQLHPTLDLVWSPSFKKPFRLNVYGRNRSYLGNYLTMVKPDYAKEDIGIVTGESSDDVWYGMDLTSSAGVTGRYDWTNSVFLFGVDYVNLLQSQKEDIYAMRARSYNSLGVNLAIASKDPIAAGLDYKVDLKYRFSDDLMNDQTNGQAGLRSHDLGFGVNVESILSGGHNLKVSTSLEMTDQSGPFDVTAAALDFAPSYVLKGTRWILEAGLRLSTVFRTDGKSSMYSHKEQVVYPDFRAEYKIFPDFLKAYAAVGGGNRMNTYSSLVGENRRLNVYYGRGVWNLLDVTEEKLDAEIGFEGRVTTRFAYTLKGGYRIYGNAPLQTLYVPNQKYGYMPGLGYTSYETAYASMDFLLDTEAVRVDGNFSFNGVTSVGQTFESRAGFIFPAPFTGDIAIMYDYKDRLYAGVDCEFSSARDGRAYRTINDADVRDYKVTVPAYADLGVELEYRFRNDMSFWARGGNLLGMTIQRELLYAEKGRYFTVGICLNF